MKQPYSIINPVLLECSQPLKDTLIKKYGFPTYLCDRLYQKSNGYGGSTSFHLDKTNKVNRTVFPLFQPIFPTWCLLSSSGSWFRFLVKQLKSQQIQMQKEYRWYEMSFFIHSLSNGAVTAFCIDVPPTFPDELCTTLPASTWLQSSNRGECLQSAIIREVLNLYDISIWTLRDVVRDIETVRNSPPIPSEGISNWHCLIEEIEYQSQGYRLLSITWSISPCHSYHRGFGYCCPHSRRVGETNQTLGGTRSGSNRKYWNTRSAIREPEPGNQILTSSPSESI